MTTPLYHVGCGRELFTLEDLRRASRGGGMAMACPFCWAGSPLVVADLNVAEVSPISLPASLVSIARNLALKKPVTPPHLEYYLGFSDFTCPAKTAWEMHLRDVLGCTSMGACPQEGCQRQYARELERWQRKNAAAG